MIDYREIIRLKSLKFSNVAIANSLCCSRNTVSEVLNLAETYSLGWPIPDTLTNKDIEHLFYPDRGTNEGRRLPDYEYVYNELAKPGVTLSLLWAEYCAKCEAEHTIPYQHTQFNEKYHAYAASKKATLRIKRKPGETMEVDWIGDTQSVFEKNTDYRSIMPQFQKDSYEKNQEFLAWIQAFAEEKNATVAQISLAWMVDKKPYLVPIPGTRKLERLKENAGASDILLTPEEVKKIDAMLEKIPMSEVFGGTKVTE